MVRKTAGYRLSDTGHMQKSYSDFQVVLVTGGTSGLGLEIARLFLQRGYYVVATGRQSIDFPEYEGRFRLYRVDFSDFQQTTEIAEKICDNHNIDIIINNAGILSPPFFMPTKDGFEYTLQVNFLSHLLLNEIIIRRFGNTRTLSFVTITSMVHKLGKLNSVLSREASNYNPLRAYSDSKLLLALMCRQMAEKYRNIGLKCFSVDPGIFSSGIFRMQNLFFRFLYTIAAPFMRKPSSVAAVLYELLNETEYSNGVVYDIRKKIKPIRKINTISFEDFMEKCYRIVISYIGF
jgi:retinol dehydrogenase-12